MGRTGINEINLICAMIDKLERSTLTADTCALRVVTSYRSYHHDKIGSPLLDTKKTVSSKNQIDWFEEKKNKAEKPKIPPSL